MLDITLEWVLTLYFHIDSSIETFKRYPTELL